MIRVVERAAGIDDAGRDADVEATELRHLDRNHLRHGVDARVRCSSSPPCRRGAAVTVSVSVLYTVTESTRTVTSPELPSTRDAPCDVGRRVRVVSWPDASRRVESEDRGAGSEHECTTVQHCLLPPRLRRPIDLPPRTTSGQDDVGSPFHGPGRHRIVAALRDGVRQSSCLSVGAVVLLTGRRPSSAGT